MEPVAARRAEPVDPLAFRRTVGHFATGVTIVTAWDGAGHHGMTANSFTSVSLAPVLVLVSVERTARFHDVVLAADAFAVNVLAADQEHLSRAFAVRGSEKDPALFGTPSAVSGAILLDGVIATLECTPWAVYDGGDHSLVVGEVVALDVPRPDTPPLLYYGGGYRSLPPPSSLPAPAASSLPSSSPAASPSLPPSP